MKKIISEVSSQITPQHLKGTELIAYRCANSDGYCVLAKLNSAFGTMYGFIPLNNSQSDPRYTSRGQGAWMESVLLASVNRQLYAFDSMKELINAIAKSKF